MYSMFRSCYRQAVTCKQQMSSGMWAIMTLLDVLDCSFSDSLVQRFSAPCEKTGREVLQRNDHEY